MDKLTNEIPLIPVEVKKAYINRDYEITDPDYAINTIEYYKQSPDTTSEELKEAIRKLNSKDKDDPSCILGCMVEDEKIVWTDQNTLHQLLTQAENQQEIGRFQISKSPSTGNFNIMTSSEDKDRAIRLTIFILNHQKQLRKGSINCLKKQAGFEYDTIYYGPVDGFKSKYKVE